MSSASHADKDDHTLLADMATGDAGALALLYERWAPAVYGVAVQGRDPAAAVERLVDTFHDFYEHAAPLAACRVDLRTYLLAAAGDGSPGASNVEVAPPQQAKSELMTRIAREQDAIVRHRPVPDFHDRYRGPRRAAQVFTAIAAAILVTVLVRTWTARKVNAAREEERKAYDRQLREREGEIQVLKSLIEKPAR